MAYNVYVACDRCGGNSFAWTNETVSINRAKKTVKAAGWQVTGDGAWYCLNCWRTIQRSEQIVYGEPLE